MIRQNIHRVGAMLLAVTLFTGMTACRKEKAGDVNGQDLSDSRKGRYVETAMELPEGISAAEIVQIGKKEGKLFFLENQEAVEETISFAEYTPEILKAKRRLINNDITSKSYDEVESNGR